jgi:O-antigen/teichoic acid export membrane protein
MNTVNQIAKNTGVLFFAQIATYILSFFSVMYTTRYLGAEGFGVLSFALAFTGIFAVFTDFGLQPFIVREVSRNKSLSSKYLANATLMKIILLATTCGLIIATINFFDYPQQTIKVVYLITLSVVFAAFRQIIYSIFQAYEKMEYQSLGQILNAGLVFCGVMIARHLGSSVIGFASIYVIANIIVLGYSIAIINFKFFNFLTRPYKFVEFDWIFWKSTIKEALPFGLTGIFIAVYYHIDTVMLSFMVVDANTVIGWYNVAYRVVLIFITISSLYVTAIFPVMSRFFSSSKASLKFIFERSIKYMLLISIPVVFGITLLADKIILLVFGSEYVHSVIALQVLIWSFLFAAIGAVFGYLLNATNRQKTLTKIVGFGMLSNVSLNMLFIPKFSYIGASIATNLTRFLVILVELIILSKIGFNLRNKMLLSDMFKIVTASSIMAGFIVCFKNANLFLLTVAAMVIYFSVLYLMKGFDEKDISLTKRIIYRRNEK